MGIFDFVKNAGEKIFKPGEARREAVIKQHMGGYGGDFANVDVEVDGDTAVLTGSVANVATKEKAVLIAGNVDGIEKVDDRITTTQAAPDFSNVSGGVASSEQAIGSGAGNVGQYASANETGWSSRTYTVKSGDTLSKISKEMYGDANKYNQIFEANKPMLKDPDKIYPGQVLRIPADV